jgi:fructokinase
MQPPPLPFNVVCFGEVLWDILPSGPLPGGAPMNVAYHLHKLGSHPALVTKIGLDNYGEKLVNLLTGSGVSTEYFYVDYDHPTGLVYANVNDHHEVAYDIVFPSAWDFIEWKDELEQLVANASYFVYGSLTSRNNTSRETLYRMLEVAKTKVLDINLRPPHFNRAGIEELLRKADILKMNLAELELVTGWFSKFQTTEERMHSMQDAFNIETLIVTMGGDGALINHDGKFYRHKGFKVEVTDTIGSGDSFLAGVLHQLLNGATLETALHFASAIGAFIATRQGACPHYEISEILALMHAYSPSEIETNSNF